MFESTLEYTSLWDVVGYKDLLASLDEKYQTEKVTEQIKYWYHCEVSRIMAAVENLRQKGKPYQAYFGRFTSDHEGHSQIIAEFWVNDMSKPKRDEHNWHLQNTSRWVYAGAMVVDKHAIDRNDERIVSTHH